MSNRKKDKTQKSSKNNKNAYMRDYDDDGYNNKSYKSDINSLSTMEYIRETVQADVQEGLLLLAKKKPKNPIEYLGKYLIERSKKKYK